MQRLRYFQTEDGSFKTKPIETMKGIVVAEIKGLNYTVVDTEGRTYLQGVGKNDVDSKKRIKETIISLGVDIETESRIHIVKQETN